MRRLLPLLAGVVVVVATGVADGVWTHRWRPDVRLENAVARLARVPVELKEKDWQGKDEEVSAKDIEAGHIDAYVCRRFTNNRTHQAVLVLLVCGRPGPIAVHTPDVCYTSAGYKMVGSPKALNVPAAYRGSEAADVFRAAWLRNPSPAARPATLHICWAWSTGRGWQTPANPRWIFARSGALYKLYVLPEQKEADKGHSQNETAKAFLEDFLPALDKALRPDS
jgi:hypothetical protein